jgi:hypothetical protein
MTDDTILPFSFPAVQAKKVTAAFDGGRLTSNDLRRLVRHIRTRWHNTRITFRGDGHYARPEAMTWCENNGIDYIFGLSGTKPLRTRRLGGCSPGTCRPAQREAETGYRWPVWF